MTHFGKIESLDFFGNGILHADGKCCFIVNALPYEEVSYSLREEKAKYSRGVATEVLLPSPQRVKAACRYYGACGGCSFQHIDYPGEAAAKENHVKRLLQQNNKEGDFTFLPLEHPKKIYGYRNHGTFQMKDGKTCYYRPGSHDLLPISHCALLEPSLNRVLAEVNAIAPKAATSLALRCDNNGHFVAVLYGHCEEEGERLLSFSDDATGVVVVNENGKTVFGDEMLRYDLDGIGLNVPYQSFFQVNTEMAVSMLRYAKELLGREKESNILLDLFCGVGSIGIYLAEHYKEIYGIEIVKEAVAHAQRNAVGNGVTATYICGKTEQKLGFLLKEAPIADTLVIDPPRQGLQKNAAAAIAQSKTEQILYISCDPASLGRDIKALAKNYKLISAKPFDLFPRTAHVETVCLLSKLHSNII